MNSSNQMQSKMQNEMSGMTSFQNDKTASICQIGDQNDENYYSNVDKKLREAIQGYAIHGMLFHLIHRKLI
jgi:hypothetical protein